MKFRKINVIGTCGSGKSTFSKQLANALHIEYLEMDAIYWQPNWGEPDDSQYFEYLKKALAREAWVLDGNYSRTTHIKWESIDAVIWLDYGFIRTFWQILKRSIQRAAVKDELWAGTGNRESFTQSFLSKKSIILWMLTHYHPNKRKYSTLMLSENFKYIKFYRLRSPKEAREFLESLDAF